MGEVYRARDTRLGRDVAIKVLPGSFAENAQSMARFKREAQALASLNHPGIASIFGLEESNGIRGIVMELVEGDTLADRLRRGAMPLDEALYIAKQVAEALEYAHDRGIIHRDLKPANVKVTLDGKVKLLDFGLAKAAESDSATSDISSSPTLSAAATQAGIILGTAAYMSPEQAKGKSVDRRADIWAFGVLLFEMLAGKPLYAGETTSEILARVIEREPDLNQLPASMPLAIRELMRRCLTKNPRQRLRDIGEARIALEEFLANPAAVQPGAASAVPALPPPRRRQLAWLFGGVALGALVAGAVFWKTRPATPQQSMMRFSAVTNFTGVDAQPSFSPDGRSVAFLSNRGGSSNIWVGLVSGGSPVRITNDPNFKARPHWSPDGSKISYSRLNESGLWDIWTVPALGGAPRKLLSIANGSAWSPDGMSLAYGDSSRHTLWICDSTGSNARELTQPERIAWHLQPAFSRDGGKIAFVRRGPGPYSELASVEVSTGKVEPITEDRALALSPLWSVDNQFVYFASTRGGSMNIWKTSAKGGPPVQITAGRGDEVSLDLSADGNKIVFDSQRLATNLLEVNVDSEAEASRRWLTTDASRGTLAPVYSPNGRQIAYFTNRKGAENEAIWIMDADGSNPVKLVEDSYLNVFPRWNRNGQSLIFTARHPGIESSRILRKLTLSDTTPLQLPPEPAESIWGDVSPDGRLVFRGTNGLPQIYDPGSNKTETLNGVRGGFLHWAPDGKHLSSVISAAHSGDPEAGVWVYDSNGGTARQVFRGWVAYYAWAGVDELFVLEGQPNLSAVLWRVRLDGSPSVRTRTTLPPAFDLPDIGSAALQFYFRFDVHPDRRRIIVEAFRFHESDISMIENIR